MIAEIDSKIVSIGGGWKLTINGFDLKINFSNPSIAIKIIKEKV